MQPHSEADWPLIARYLAGECTPEETDRLEAALVDDRGLALLLDELRTVWQQAGHSPKGRDVERAWNELMIAARTEKPATLGRDRPAVRRERRPHPSRKYGMRLAIVMAFAITGALMVVRLGGWGRVADTEEIPKDRIYAADRGVRVIVYLTDGTQVRLNSGSQLVVDGAFGDRYRRVRLRGEAFFAVASDSLRPLVVETERALVHVRGTSFNVRAYEENDLVEVYVVEGEVSLGRAGQDLDSLSEAEKKGLRRLGHARLDTLILQPNHLGVATDQQLQAIRSGVSSFKYLAWTENILVFDKAPFDAVKQQLERWYDLDIELKAPTASVDRLNATFSDEPLSEILNVVAAALQLEYERKQRRIVFFPAREQFEDQKDPEASRL